VEAAERASARAAKIRRPNPYVRASVVLLIGGALARASSLSPKISITVRRRKEVKGASAFVQFLDASLESIAFLFGGALFLVTLESRLKRAKLIAAVHELRSLAHIIDMHQLTKSPDHY